MFVRGPDGSETVGCLDINLNAHTIKLAEVAAIDDSGAARDGAFDLIAATIVYKFRADSPAEAAKWISALRPLLGRKHESESTIAGDSEDSDDISTAADSDEDCDPHKAEPRCLKAEPSSEGSSLAIVLACAIGVVGCLLPFSRSTTQMLLAVVAAVCLPLVSLALRRGPGTQASPQKEVDVADTARIAGTNRVIDGQRRPAQAQAIDPSEKKHVKFNGTYRINKQRSDDPTAMMKAMGVPRLAIMAALRLPRKVTIEHDGVTWTETMVTAAITKTVNLTLDGAPLPHTDPTNWRATLTIKSQLEEDGQCVVSYNSSNQTLLTQEVRRYVLEDGQVYYTENTLRVGDGTEIVTRNYFDRIP